MAEIINPDKTLVPRLTVPEGTEVLNHFYDNVDAAVNSAIYADRLNLGWRLDGFMAPVSDNEDVQEYRLTVWKEVRSDASVLGKPKPEEVGA